MGYHSGQNKPMEPPDTTSPVLIPRVVMKNYKSIEACDVRLKNLTFLVGANGSGKSNFVDGLRFVSDSLRASLDHALRDRGGINEVRRRSSGHPTHFSIRLDLRVNGFNGHYAFSVGAKKNAGFEVQVEECQIGTHFYSVQSGLVKRSTLTSPPPAAPDRLYLVNAAGVQPFRLVYDALSRMGFYNLNPEEIRELQPPDPGNLLRRDGSNLASVLGQLAAHSPITKKRIEEYLEKVVPGVVGVERRNVGPKETLEFRQVVGGAQKPWRFYASSMSDGTLRALGVLVAIFQATNGTDVPLVGLEEPEVALHPAAAGLLRDGLRDASTRTQLLVTSHGSDLLDDKDLDPDTILAVASQAGATLVGPVSGQGLKVLKEHLYTAGELLRLDQLKPDPAAIPTNPTLFDL